MNGQRIFVKGRTFELGDPALQTALAAIYETPERPRCLCVEGGVDLYISRRSSVYHLARMPGTGNQHHPTCPDYEPNPASSGRGALMGDAIVEKSAETLEIHVGFPLSRSIGGRAIPRGEATPPKDVHAPKHRLSLQAVLHTLYETARFNRWYPAMEGARNQGVLCKYLMEAANHILVRGEPLARRLYVPEPFTADRKDEIAARRREKLAFLNASDQGEGIPVRLRDRRIQRGRSNGVVVQGADQAHAGHAALYGRQGVGESRTRLSTAVGGDRGRCATQATHPDGRTDLRQAGKRLSDRTPDDDAGVRPVRPFEWRLRTAPSRAASVGQAHLHQAAAIRQSRARRHLPTSCSWTRQAGRAATIPCMS